jgi:hypothetical protein
MRQYNVVFLGDWVYEYSDEQYPAQGQGGGMTLNFNCNQSKEQYNMVLMDG